LDHHNLPVVAGDCLLALPITLRHAAEVHADLSGFIEVAGACLVFLLSASVSLNIFPVNGAQEYFLRSQDIAAVQPLTDHHAPSTDEAENPSLFSIWLSAFGLFAGLPSSRRPGASKTLHAAVSEFKSVRASSASTRREWPACLA
jgi:hypothetical protein